MGRRDKLLLSFLSQPKDFTFNELVKLLNNFDFYEISTGKTSDSRICFQNENYTLNVIKFHKPHPNNIIKRYVLDNIKTNLEECNLL